MFKKQNRTDCPKGCVVVVVVVGGRIDHMHLSSGLAIGQRMGA